MRTTSVAAFLLLTALQGAAQRVSTPSTKTVTRVEVEVIYIGRGGFFPTHIKRPIGKFSILLVNKDRLVNLNPAIADSQGKSASQMALGSSSQAQPYQSTAVLNLEKGRFHLKEPSHPTWDVTIDIGD